MTPKEKAKELTYSMLSCLDGDSFNEAKQCALMAVDEIINVTIGLTDFTDDFEYWEKVKQEIEKL